MMSRKDKQDLSNFQVKKIALFNVNGAFYAIDDSCTHRGGPLSKGAIEKNTVTCPWHGASFDLASGQALCAPAHAPVGTYNVRVAAGYIEIEI